MPIIYDVNDGIGLFTIDNGKVNAITHKMHEEFYEYLKEFLSDDKVKGLKIDAISDLNSPTIQVSAKQYDSFEKILQKK